MGPDTCTSNETALTKGASPPGPTRARSTENSSLRPGPHCLSSAVNQLVRSLFWHSSLMFLVSPEWGETIHTVTFLKDTGQLSGLICEGREFLLLGPRCRCFGLVSASSATSQCARQDVARRQSTAEEEHRPRGGRRKPTKGRAYTGKMKTLVFLLLSQCEFKTAYTFGICHN